MIYLLFMITLGLMAYMIFLLKEIDSSVRLLKDVKKQELEHQLSQDMARIQPFKSQVKEAPLEPISKPVIPEPISAPPIHIISRPLEQTGAIDKRKLPKSPEHRKKISEALKRNQEELKKNPIVGPSLLAPDSLSEKTSLNKIP